MRGKSPLQLEAYNYIKELILSNKLDVDTLYSETKLSKEPGISRTPMREALQCLSQDGYISILPSKGFIIRALNKKDMKESIQIRCAIEGFCTHALASQIKTKKAQDTINKLGKILENQKKAALDTDDLEPFIQYDHEFHLTLISFLENDEVNHIFQRLMYLIQLTSNSTLEAQGRIQGTLDEHEKYFEYLKAGDVNNAYITLVNHLMMPLNIVKTTK